MSLFPRPNPCHNCPYKSGSISDRPELEQAKAEIARLKDLINDHNMRCADECERCDVSCNECPMSWHIELITPPGDKDET